MNNSKRIPFTDSDIADDDDDYRGHRKGGPGKDKLNRNLSEKKRRDQFNMLVNELGTMVSTSSKKMDKSTVLKSTISFLKDHQETANQAQVHGIKEDWKPTFLTNDEFMHLMLEALDSFLLVFTQQGSILYSSESVTSLLGHLPSDMVNRSLYEYIDKSDSARIHNILHNCIAVATDLDGKDDKLVCFECNFRRGGIDPNEAVKFEPAVVRASFRWPAMNSGEDSIPPLHQQEMMYFLCIVRLRASQLVREMSMVEDNKEFTSRHSLEWKFLFLDHRAPPIIGYLPFEVLGTSGYDYYHPDDLDYVTVSHEQLMKTGEGTSCYYRFLTKGQQWIWLRTRFYITYHQWSSKPEFINCTNTVVSFADVRSQKRKDMGLVEENDSSRFSIEPVTKSSRCSSIGSANSDSNVCAITEKEGSDRAQLPTSTSQVCSRSVSHKLQQFLHRHFQEQQSKTAPVVPGASGVSGAQAQQVVVSSTPAQSPIATPPTAPTQTQTSSNSTTFSNLPLGHLLYNNRGQQQKTDGQPVRIASRPSSSSTIVSEQTTPPLMVATPVRTQPSSDRGVIVNPGPVNTVPSPVVPDLLDTNLFITPVQKQLHEQLQQKASQVQNMIFKQQEELKKIHQQLLFAQGSVASPTLIPSPADHNITSTDMGGGILDSNISVLGSEQHPSRVCSPSSVSTLASATGSQLSAIQSQQQHTTQGSHGSAAQQLSNMAVSHNPQQQQTVQVSASQQQLSLHNQQQHSLQQQCQQQSQNQQVAQCAQQQTVQTQSTLPLSQQQDTTGSVPAMVNVAMQNVLVNQSPVLSFPMLSQDSDVYLMLQNPPDTQPQ